MSKAVNLFVFDSLADWEPGYAIAGIQGTSWQKQPGRYFVRTVGLTKDPVRTMGGMTVLPDIALADLTIEDSAMLILPGGFVWDEEPAKLSAAIDKARDFIAGGVPVAAICAATAALARSGLLDSCRHTSNDKDYLLATGYGGSDRYEDAPAVTDGNVITAPGTAPLDFAYHIFRRLDVYTDGVLEAWYGLYKTGQPEYFYALVREISAGGKGA